MLNNKEHTCCFTGHRKIADKDIKNLYETVKAEIVKLVETGYTDFCVGGAVGFDILSEEVVLNLKEEYPQIKLHLILPCREQAKSFSPDDKEKYDRFLSLADSVEYVSEHYVRGCMHMRNRRLVDESSVCICYLNSDKGGTAYTVKYAEKSGLKIINTAG